MDKHQIVALSCGVILWKLTACDPGGKAQSPLVHDGNALCIHMESWPQQISICSSRCQKVCCLPSNEACHAQDGMDQSKWALPRARRSRLTKSETPLQRPRMKIQGVWFLAFKSCMSVNIFTFTAHQRY